MTRVNMFYRHINNSWVAMTRVNMFYRHINNSWVAIWRSVNMFYGRTNNTLQIMNRSDVYFSWCARAVHAKKIFENFHDQKCDMYDENYCV